MGRVVTNISAGIRITASGVEIAPGASVKLDDKDDKHPVTQDWIDRGDLLDVAADAKARAAEAKATIAEAKAAE